MCSLTSITLERENKFRLSFGFVKNKWSSKSYRTILDTEAGN